MTIREITSKEVWEEFLHKASPHTFLQSWNWGSVQEALGARIFRLGVYEGEVLSGVALILLIEARRGSFLFCPHGPIARNSEYWPKVMETVSRDLKEKGAKSGASFIRISPLVPTSGEGEETFKHLGFRQAPVHLMHPELAWVLDIRKDEAVLLKEMRKTTRYLIRKAEREGVIIREGISEDDLNRFFAVYRKTVDRQNFTPFKNEFFQTELAIFKKDNQIKIFLAEYEEKIIAAAMIVFYGHSAFYHHGASDQTYSHVPASYLLQWRAIQEAKRRGLSFYNFWGVVRPEERKHPWFGLSLFKMGFGGRAEEYLHAQDYVLASRYWFVYLIEKLRRIRKGL